MGEHRALPNDSTYSVENLPQHAHYSRVSDVPDYHHVLAPKASGAVPPIVCCAGPSDTSRGAAGAGVRECLLIVPTNLSVCIGIRIPEREINTINAILPANDCGVMSPNPTVEKVYGE